ncbi:MAG: hypothetical protein Q8O41_02270 [Candidatus Methanoperedens sp.]|nr:hypothetical protein [Candidatus Methanoperedens sp.]
MAASAISSRVTRRLSRRSCSATNPGKRCVDVSGVGQLQADTTCPNCYDTDTANDPKVKGTCYDTVNSLCSFTSGGCKDTCASNGVVTEYYCAGSVPPAQTWYAQETCNAAPPVFYSGAMYLISDLYSPVCHVPKGICIIISLM